MKKHEAKFTTRLIRWIDNHRNEIESGPIEVKVTTGNSIPFNAVKQHQEIALVQSRRDVFAYKISDESRGHKPFDIVVYKEAKAYVALAFLKPGVSGQDFWIIDVEYWVRLCNSSTKRKSVTEKMLFDKIKTYPHWIKRYHLGTSHS